MVWAVLFLITCASAGRLIDFLIGSRGRRRTKDRLADFYVLVAEGTWNDLLRGSTAALDTFLTKILGGRLLSRQATSRLTLGGVLTDLSILVAGMAFSKDGGFKLFAIFSIWQFTAAVVIVLASNAIVDTLTYALARATWRRALRGRPPRAQWELLIIDVALVYLAVCVTLLIATPLMLATFTSTNERSAMWLYPYLLKGYMTNVWTEPFASGMTLGSFRVPFLAFSAALPIVLHLLVTFTLVFFHISRPLVQRPLKVMLERIDEAPGGIFTTIGTALGVFATILAALATALR